MTDEDFIRLIRWMGGDEYAAVKVGGFTIRIEVEEEQE